MEADREFTWTKVPGGYRVVVEDRTIIYAPTGYIVECDAGTFNGLPIHVAGRVGSTVDSGSFVALTRI